MFEDITALYAVNLNHCRLNKNNSRRLKSFYGVIFY